MKKEEKILTYWDQRAIQNQDVTAATTDDIYLRELEIVTISEVLQSISIPKNSKIIDIGCGDGYSTIRVAETCFTYQFLGIDYSPNMVENAVRHLSNSPELQSRVRFVIGDVTNLDTCCDVSKYNCAITDRCLINLESIDKQSRAIEQIAKHIKTGGYYMAIENFVEGHQNLNQVRKKMGLPEIEIRWHNLFFFEKEFLEITERFFNLVEMRDFSSSYYFSTRIIYSKMCQMQGQKPDYKHDIHKLSVDLPAFGQFSPIRMAILRKR